MTNFLAAAAFVALLIPRAEPARDDVISAAPFRGPPWISIEHPVNPHDVTTRDAFLVVHAYHHGTPTEFPLRATAEGVVSGQRRTVQLALRPTSRPGVFAVRKQWGDAGVWTLVIEITDNGKKATAQALVEIASTGTVAAVRVPSRQQDGWTIPAPLAMADVESALQARAAQLARR